MAINSLFDLDPSKFSLGRGSGTFRRVGEVGGKLSLAELLKGVNTPAVPTNIPVVNPMKDTTKEFFSNLQNLIASTAGTVSSQMSTHPAASYIINNNNLFDYDWPRSLRFMKEHAAANTVEGFQTQYKSYKTEGDTYNQQVKAYKAAVAPYEAELEAYNKEREARAANYNTSAINPELVTKQAQEATGDVLAESDLYSDDLHNMMIDRISTQPIIDKMSTMFSVGGK